MIEVPDFHISFNFIVWVFGFNKFLKNIVFNAPFDNAFPISLTHFYNVYKRRMAKNLHIYVKVVAYV